jgi:hypothetical protein
VALDVTLVPDVGAANANSYVSLDEADAYLNARLNGEAWHEEGDEQVKLAALVLATQELDLLPWVGWKALNTAALQWPRKYVPDPEYAADSTEWYLAENVIPKRVKEATYELALEILRGGDSDITGRDSKEEIIREKLDVIDKEYANPSQKQRGLNRYPRILRLVSCFLDTTGAGTFTRDRA